MTRWVTDFAILVCATHVLLSSFAKATANEELVFGFGAEDDVENILETAPSEIDYAGDINGIKSPRQDPEDVEILLNRGPLIAPNIVLNRFVDSRIAISSGIQDLSLTQAESNRESDPVDTEYLPSHDDLSDFMFGDLNKEDNEMQLTHVKDTFTNKMTNTAPCRMKFAGPTGMFNISFEKDCIVQIMTPDVRSRLILSCSPIALGNCATDMESLSVNLLGDMKFKSNSYMYCGGDTSIKTISLKNKLAIRIKKTDSVSETSQCTFHSRKYRQFDQNNPSATCGRLGRTSKIVGGRRVPPGLFPWVAQLDITRTDGSQTGCTGSIVSPHYILTAAHCMKRAESISAFMGGTDRHDILGTELLIQAEKYILHKKWSSRTLVADIALVKLTEPIQYTEDISPICLPEGKLLTEDFSTKRGVAVGWGRIDSKKKAPRRLYRVKLPLMSEISCKQIYRRFFIPKVMMCTDSKRDAAICYGMSRSSLIRYYFYLAEPCNNVLFNIDT